MLAVENRPASSGFIEPHPERSDEGRVHRLSPGPCGGGHGQVESYELQPASLVRGDRAFSPFTTVIAVTVSPLPLRATVSLLGDKSPILPVQEGIPPPP